MPEELKARIQRILCPTDLSDLSLDGLALALDFALVQRAQVLVLHVAARRNAGVEAARRPPIVPSTSDTRLALARLVAVARGRGISADGVVLEGDAAGGILGHASSWSADMIVMGTQGQRSGRAWTLGSVAERVLRVAPCPVLVTAAGAGRSASWRPRLRHILCPSDLSEASCKALEYGALLAGAFRARITPLHVLEWFPGSGEPPHLYIPEYQMDASQEARERLVRSIPGSVRPFCTEAAVVAVGRPHREILRVARERDVDLIVLGVHHQRALDRTLGGGTLCHVVRETCCPVLAVRAAVGAAAREPTAPAGPARRAS